MDTSRHLILINGEDKTDSIVSCQPHGNKCDVVYNNSTRTYSYNSCNVRIIKLKREIDPKTVIFKYKGITINNIEKIHDFGEFYRVIRSGKKELSCKRLDVEILNNCLADTHSGELFQYFKETAAAISLKTENGINILSRQYDKIEAVEECTVLSR